MTFDPQDLFDEIARQDPTLTCATLIIARFPDGNGWWAQCGSSKIGRGENATEAYSNLCEQYGLSLAMYNDE